MAYKYTRGGNQALIGTFPSKEKNSAPTHPPHVQALQRNIWTLIKRTKRSRDSTEYVHSPCVNFTSSSSPAEAAGGVARSFGGGLRGTCGTAMIGRHGVQGTVVDLLQWGMPFSL